MSAFNLRAGFDSGTIRIRDLVALYPFDNTLRAVRISGAQLKEYLEHSARYYRTDAVGRISIDPGVPGYDFDVIAGARYDIDLRRPIGDRIRNLNVGRRAVTRTDSFTLAVNSHRQTGAGGYTMLRGAPVVYDKEENIRDLLIRGDPDSKDDRACRLRPSRVAHRSRGCGRRGSRPVPDPGSPVAGGSARHHAPPGAGDRRSARRPAAEDPGAGQPRAAERRRSRRRWTAWRRTAPVPRCGSTPATRCRARVASNVTRGRAMVEVLNRLGIAATALGEHDLDWSLDTLRRRMSEARYRWLAANVFDSATREAPRLGRPLHGAPVGGLKVAVVGYITAEAKTSVKAGTHRRTSLRRRRAGHPRRAGRGPGAASRSDHAAGSRGGSCDGPVVQRRG